jgi:tyrosyl-tRNA synthetase
VAEQVKRIFAGNDFEMVNNYDWFKDLKYLEFLRDVGKHYSMTELLQRDYIAARLGEGSAGISYAEFSYSLIQGYDYWWLFKNKGVELQIGGSDQWGNMLSGAPLIRKKEGKEVHALSMPLTINKATGKKFGKSEEGAVWLDPAKTSPAQFYQFWINCDDEGIEDYLKIYTALPKDEIEALVGEHRSNPKERLAQKRLAEEVTRLVHGEEALGEAQQFVEYLKSASPSASEEATYGVRVGGSVVEALVGTGLASSNREARQLLADRGVYINDQQAAKESFEESDFANGFLKLRRGKTLQNTVTIKLEP